VKSFFYEICPFHFHIDFWKGMGYNERRSVRGVRMEKGAAARRRAVHSIHREYFLWREVL